MRRFLATAVAVAAVAAGGTVATPAAFPAGRCERGPNPTRSILEASRGPFATASQSVSTLSVSGFGGGTIYYPTDAAQGTFGAVAISPGFTARWSSLAWLGCRWRSSAVRATPSRRCPAIRCRSTTASRRRRRSRTWS